MLVVGVSSERMFVEYFMSRRFFNAKIFRACAQFLYVFSNLQSEFSEKSRYMGYHVFVKVFCRLLVYHQGNIFFLNKSYYCCCYSSNVVVSWTLCFYRRDNLGVMLCDYLGIPPEASWRMNSVETNNDANNNGCFTVSFYVLGEWL